MQSQGTTQSLVHSIQDYGASIYSLGPPSQLSTTQSKMRPFEFAPERYVLVRPLAYAPRPPSPTSLPTPSIIRQLTFIYCTTSIHVNSRLPFSRNP